MRQYASINTDILYLKGQVIFFSVRVRHTASIMYSLVMRLIVKYLTIDDVCDMLSISRRTLERMRPDTSSGGPLANLLLDRRERFAVNTSNSLGGINTQGARINFPMPDLYIGKSPRWERDKLIAWLEENGRYL